jgi:CheY-like chemotaxis protein
MNRTKILIVDDEENFTRLVKSNLERTGKYEVRIENKGVLGLIAAKEFSPDLILLDVMMPDMDGGDVCSQMENDREVKDIPIVFLTAIVSKEETRNYDEIIGGRPFIAKPVDIEDLIDIIEKNLRP